MPGPLPCLTTHQPAINYETLFQWKTGSERKVISGRQSGGWRLPGMGGGNGRAPRGPARGKGEILGWAGGSHRRPLSSDWHDERNVLRFICRQPMRCPRGGNEKKQEDQLPSHCRNPSMKWQTSWLGIVKEKRGRFWRAIFREGRTKLDLGWTETMKEKARKVVMSLTCWQVKKSIRPQ